MIKLRARAWWLVAGLVCSIPVLVILATACSETHNYSLSETFGLLPGFESSLRSHEHTILKLRLMRALCAVAVGGSLALAGALAQGVFRNPMAEPGLLGVSSGAALGAFIGIAVLGGYARPDLVGLGGALSGGASLVIVPLFAFIGALVTAFAIYRFATRAGRVSVALLLLTGLAANSLIGSVLAALQVLLLQDFQVSRAFLAWGFGSLDDKQGLDLVVVWSGALIALGSIPFVALELDLLAGGEEDAAALGSDPARVKTVVLVCLALATAAAVAISGPIAFVGLLVPQVVRLMVGPHHRVLLPLSFLAGGVLLLFIVVLQHVVSPTLAGWCAAADWPLLASALGRFTALQPGVLTSLIGAPFFLFLLLRQGRVT